jgi:hypothetical protein
MTAEQRDVTKRHTGTEPVPNSSPVQGATGDGDAGDQTARTLQNATKVPTWYRVAAELLWARPSVTHAEIAQQVGRSRVTVTRALHTPAFQQALDDAGQPYVNQLTIAAHRGLLQAWAKGRAAAVAMSLLRSRGLVKPERVEVTGADGAPLVPSDLAEQIRYYADRLAAGEGR